MLFAWSYPVQSGPPDSGPVFSGSDVWSVIFQSCIFRSCIFQPRHLVHHFQSPRGNVYDTDCWQVSKKLGLAHTPSAFQIRFGGCKGVLSVWPSLDGEQIQIRKSMKKFESDHNKLDVVNYSSPGINLELIDWLKVLCPSRHQIGYLARPAAKSRHGGYYILLLFLIYILIYFLTILLMPIISTYIPGLVELLL